MPPAGSHPVLTAENLERRFATRAGETVGVHGVSLSLERGETVALLGPNGSGKSTLLGMLATIVPPHAGRVTITGEALDRDTSHAARVRARSSLGVVFQTHALDPLLTVRENLRIAAALYRLARPDDRIDEALADLGVSDRAGDRVGTLSGGLARRADLARAMLHAPSVLLLDEPTTGLDPEARTDLLSLLDGLATTPDAPAVLHSTHLTDEAEHADRVVIMHHGRIAASGTPDELRARLGARTLVLEHEPGTGDTDRAMLESHGATVSPPGARRSTASFPASETNGAADAASALLESGRRFRVGPPSLADVYAACVGDGRAPLSNGADRDGEAG